GVSGEPGRDGGPGIVVGEVGVGQRGQQRRVVGPGTGHRGPAVGGGQQAARAPGGDRAGAVEAGEGRAFGEQTGAVHPDRPTRRVGDPRAEGAGAGGGVPRRDDGGAVGAAGEGDDAALGPVPHPISAARGPHRADVTVGAGGHDRSWTATNEPSPLLDSPTERPSSRRRSPARRPPNPCWWWISTTS